MRAAIVKAKVNAIHTEGRHKETKPIDGPISFPPVNPNKIIIPHYDALVLTLCINSFYVNRVLVDPSSAADLLQLLAFKQMKLSLGVVNSSKRILFGFNGATTITLGDVSIRVKAGPVTQQVLFSIIKDLGPFNAIMGGGGGGGVSLLHSMKIIPSTYHQTVNYLTNARQVDLLCNQLTAQQCYQLSVREQRGEKSTESPPLQEKTPA